MGFGVKKNAFVTGRSLATRQETLVFFGFPVFGSVPLNKTATTLPFIVDQKQHVDIVATTVLNRGPKLLTLT